MSFSSICSGGVGGCLGELGSVSPLKLSISVSMLRPTVMGSGIGIKGLGCGCTCKGLVPPWEVVAVAAISACCCVK